jgi:hypothetical protein
MVRRASVAVATCFIAEAMPGAFCLRLSAVVPLAAACRDGCGSTSTVESHLVFS